MATTTNTVPASFDLARISLVEAIFIECTIAVAPTEFAADGPTQFEVQQVLLEPGFDMDVKQVFYIVNVKTRSVNAQQEPTGATGTFRLRFTFEVENISEYTQINPDFKGPFPVRDLMVMLGGVAYSTARGLLLGKTNGTILSGFALPLRSPLEIFQESIEALAAQQEPTPKKRAPARRKPKAQ